MRNSIQTYRRVLSDQEKEVEILEVQVAYTKASEELKRLEEMDMRQMIKLIAEKLIMISAHLTSKI